MLHFHKGFLRQILFVVLFFAAPFAKAELNIDSLFIELDALENDSIKIIYLNKVVFNYCRINYNIANQLSDSALLYSKKLGSPFLISLSYMNKGNAKKGNGDFSSSLANYDSALKIAIKMKNKRALASNYHNIGNLYRIRGEFDLALENLYKSIEYTTDSVRRAARISNIAAVYHARNDFNKAIEIYLKANSILEKANKTLYLINNYTALSISYREINEYGLATLYSEKALSLSNESNDLKGQASALSSLGRISYLQGDFLKGISYLKQAMEIADKIGDELTFMGIQILLTEVYNKTKDYDRSIFFAKQTEIIAKKVNSKSVLEDTYFFLSDSYYNKGNYKKAYDYLKLNKKANDTINKEKAQKRINELQTKYETKEKEQQITLLEQENKIKQTEINQKGQQRNWLTGFFIAMLIVTTVIYFYYKKTKTAKNKIETLQREIHHRVKNNLAINRRMVEVAEDKTKDPESRRILQQLEMRIASMAEIHEQLYRKNDITTVDFKKYLNDINERIASSFEMDIPEINQSFSEDIEIGFDKAVPLGLIVNELLTNAYKYAKNGTILPKITIDVAKEPGNIRLKVSDNGNGFPEGFDLNTVKSYGLKLVNGLTHQLNGKIKLFNMEGANVEIVVPL